MRLNKDRPIKWARLALTTCQENPNKHLFKKYLNMFIKAHKFAPGMAPFANQTFGPKWFKDPFPGGFPQAATQLNAIWRAFFTPTLLSYKIEIGSKGYYFMSYQPNLVAHQFCLSQMVPKLLVSHVTDIVWPGQPLNANDHKACLHFCKSTQCYELPVFKFQQSFLTTVDFDECWAAYQSQAFSNDQFLQNMVDALSTIADDIPPLSPHVNAPDHIIQTEDVDEAPRKVYVTTFIPSFLVDAKLEVSVIRVERGLFPHLNQLWPSPQKNNGRHRPPLNRYFALMSSRRFSILTTFITLLLVLQFRSLKKSLQSIIRSLMIACIHIFS